MADISYFSKLHNNPIPTISTPNLDALASNSLILKDYYTHPICGPSRAALLTGRSASACGFPFPLTTGGSLDPSFATIGHELRLRGYATHFVGKWGVDLSPSLNDTPGPLPRGFDSFYGLFDSAHDHYAKRMGRSPVDWHLHNATHRLDYPLFQDPRMLDYSTSLFAEKASELLASWTPERPSFLHLSFTAPHDPLQVPDRYLLGTPCAALPNLQRRIYCGMVLALDEAIGALAAQLRRQGMLDHTVIFVASDNGAVPIAGGLNYPFRGQKLSLYEGGLRVPAFIHAPAWVRPRVYRGLFHVADVAPTLLGLVDAVSLDRPLRHRLLDQDRPIDGLDHAAQILHGQEEEEEKKDQQERWRPTRSHVFDYLVAFNRSFYLKDGYKLILGRSGDPDLITEPRSWLYSDLHGYEVAAQLLYQLFHAVSPRLAVMGILLRQQLLDTFLSEGEGPIFSSPTVATKEHLPFVDWAAFDAGHSHMVQLYNLSAEPYEQQNIAGEERQIVEKMAEELRNQILATASEQQFVVLSFLVQSTAWIPYAFMLIALVFLIIIVSLILYLIRFSIRFISSITILL